MAQTASQATLAPRTLLAKRYRVEELIGSGGYASVYRATDQHFNAECALKELIDPDPGVRRQFQLEAELLIRAKHKNIPNGYQVFEDRGRMYLAMEYIRGKDLEELLNDSLVTRNRPLDEPQVLRWMIDICDALIHVHTQPVPVIHRDIKPANIKIRPDGSPVLIDFGLAKQQRSGNPTMTAAQGVSPGFAPPEQYMAKGRTDARTDIYALGATLYACLTGKDPPEAPARLLAQTGAVRSGGEALVAARRRNPRVSEMTDRIITKALEISPMQRQQTARVIRGELNTALLALAAATNGALPAASGPRRRAAGASPDDNGTGKQAAAANGAGANGAGAVLGALPPIAPAPPGARRGGKQPAAPAAEPRPTKQVAAVAVQSAPKPTVAAAAGRAARQAAAQADARTGKQAVPEPRAARQPGMNQPPMGRADYGQVAGTAGALALAPSGKVAAVAVMKPASSSARNPVPGRVSAGRRSGPRAWINRGDTPLNVFGKWMLALAFIEALWGLSVLALGILVVTMQTMQGKALPLPQLGLSWLGVVLVVSLLGGQALSRPVYRRGHRTNLQRGLLGSVLALLTIAIHAIGGWGVLVFAYAQPNSLLAMVAFILFGVNVLVIGALSVHNALA